MIYHLKKYAFISILLVCKLTIQAQTIIYKPIPHYRFLPSLTPTISILNDTSISNKPPIRPIASNLYTLHLAFFCRQELKFEHTLKVPFIFRVGDPAFCNWYEQKPGYILLQH